MSLGVIMLIHTGFDRAAEMVGHWTQAGCPVVIHIDKKSPARHARAFQTRLADNPLVRFSRRHRCDWGTWGLVAATQDAATLLLEDFPQISHVFLASGACLPLRPVAELSAYLAQHPDTDFIESATTAEVPWTVGGLDKERFTLRFPFGWKRRRWLFDGWVRLQQVLRLRRRIPEGLTPHMGSQWWCLTRQTLDAILSDPQRPTYDRYFRRVWIPDESYFQTLARLHARKIESRSLTLAKFDYQGKPHIFFDDHLEMLHRSGCFVARKIWRDADRLYAAFPRRGDDIRAGAEPQTSVIDHIFSQAVARRTLGRPGLYMQSRFPTRDRESGFAAVPYTVLHGFAPLFADFPGWLSQQSGVSVHGHLFAPDRVHFADGGAIYRGALSDNARLRDYNPKGFLTNLVWNSRDTHPCFLYGPADSAKAGDLLRDDANAGLWVISGAWAVPLYLSGQSASAARAEAARLQRAEDRFLRHLRSPGTRARYHVQTLAQFLAAPLGTLQPILDEIAGHRGSALHALPAMPDLTGLPDFLQDLKNQGMHPYLTGDIAAIAAPPVPVPRQRKPYIVVRK